MIFRYLFLCFLCSVAITGSAQLLVDDSLTPVELVENILPGGGVTLGNVFFNGVPAPGVPQVNAGAFISLGPSPGMPAGVVLSTGSLASIPNDASVESSDDLSLGGNPDLALLAGGAVVMDAAVLEFDVVPTGDMLVFRYVFASEEYADRVCAANNDVFGFFLSGPGIAGPFTNGAENIALVPGTNIPVALNTVNSGVAGVTGDPANCAAMDPDWTGNSVYFVDNSFGFDLVHDGYTVVLEASAAVQCGATYRIKIAIGDVGDPFFDSALFIEAGSFSSNGPVTPQLVAGGFTGETMVAGCGPFEMAFTRAGDLGQALTVDVLAGGAAAPVIDYDPPFPGTITFAPGEATVYHVFDVFNNGSGLQTLILTVGDETCAAMDNVFTFYIDSPAPLNVQLNDLIASCGDPLLLEPVVSGGDGNYQYLWSTLEITPSITAPGSGTYELTVSDGCGADPVLVSANVTLDVVPLELILSPGVVLPCPGSVDVTVQQVNNGDGNYTYEWSLGGNVVGTDATHSATIPGTYEVVVTDGCGATGTGTVIVSPDSPQNITLVMDPQAVLPCVGPVEIGVVSVNGGATPYVFDWTLAGAPAGSAGSIMATATGWHVVTVMEACGGTATDSVLVVPDVAVPMEITVTPDMELQCQQQGLVSVTVTSGGTTPYTYQWTINGVPISSGMSTTVPAAGTVYYVVTVTDLCGASIQDSVQVSAIVHDDLQIVTPGVVQAFCPGTQVELEVLGVFGGYPAYALEWTNEDGELQGIGNTLDVVVEETVIYTINAVDACGNTGSTTLTAELLFDPGLQVRLPEDMTICPGDDVAFMAEVIGGSGLYYLEWEDMELTDPWLYAAPLQTTTYSVTVYDECGPLASDQVRVTVQYVTVGIVQHNTGQDDWYLEAVTTPATSRWLWDMGDGYRYRTPQVDHSYFDLEDHWVMLEVWTPEGCSATDSLLIEPPAHIYFPSAFTPDGDGFNEVFGPVGHSIHDFEMLIFDRWGHVIFTSHSIDEPWDGMVRGKQAPTGVYIYKYRAEGHFFPEIRGTGHVTLLRGDWD